MLFVLLKDVVKIVVHLKVICIRFISNVKRFITVRRYAVKILDKSSDDELVLYLLQLVQALKYESHLQGSFSSKL